MRRGRSRADLSLLDGLDGGWTLDDSVVFAREFYAGGVDVIDCSSGGAIADRSSDTRVCRGYAFHAPYSRELRQRTGGMVATVGLIVDPHQAEAVLEAGDGHRRGWSRVARRAQLAQPRALDGGAYDAWHREAGWWLQRPMPALRALADAGETPLTRYADLTAPPAAT